MEASTVQLEAAEGMAEVQVQVAEVQEVTVEVPVLEAEDQEATAEATAEDPEEEAADKDRQEALLLEDQGEVLLEEAEALRRSLLCPSGTMSLASNKSCPSPTYQLGTAIQRAPSTTLRT
jgi:hypothetical protein